MLGELGEDVADRAVLEVVADLPEGAEHRVGMTDTIGVTRDGVLDLGVVVAVDMPLTIHDGDMRVDVGVF